MNLALAKLVESERIMKMTDLNCLQYVAARMMLGCSKPRDPTKDQPTPRDPDHALKVKIERTRQWIGRLTAAIASKTISSKVKALLQGKEVQTVLTTYKMRLATQCKNLRTKLSRRKCFNNNKIHRFKVKALYHQMRHGENPGVKSPPTEEEVRKYWGDLLGTTKEHTIDATWIGEEESEMMDIKQDKWEDITEEQMRSTTAKLSNWKSPGLDQVQNFWIKYFSALHRALTRSCNTVIRDLSQAPEWLTSGKTTLIHKKGLTDDAKNYRPITCLLTYYKLLTLFLIEKIYAHVTTNLILSLEQKGCCRKAQRCKY